jgi:hypothetical protein
MKYIILILAIFTIACSPQTRLDRLLKHHPELIKTDSISKIDTTQTKDSVTKLDSAVINSSSGTIHVNLADKDVKFTTTDKTVHIDVKKDSTGYVVSVSKDKETVYFQRWIYHTVVTIHDKLIITKKYPPVILKDKIEALKWYWKLLIGFGIVLIIVVIIKKVIDRLL